MTDCIVVGLGLAGLSFCETLRKNDKSFLVVNDASQTASRVAGGLINPVVLKRFNLSWQADAHLPIAMDTYRGLATLLETEVVKEETVWRRFSDVSEQNNWFQAADKPRLSPFLSPKIQKNENPALKADLGFGQVLRTARMDTAKVLSEYVDWLKRGQRYLGERFDYSALSVSNTGVSYKGHRARHLIFAEGYGMKRNPYFNYLPMPGSKGEYLIIHAPELRASSVIKTRIFLLPLGNHLYKVGANYNRDDKTNNPTLRGGEQLCEQLENCISCPYEVVYHVAGVRPTVKDRRPLVGKHPNAAVLWCLNGFGSHGLINGPWAARQLYGTIFDQTTIAEAVDISRFRHLYPG